MKLEIRMMGYRYRIPDIPNIPNNRFLLDANVLMYLFSPIYSNKQGSSKVGDYTKVYSSLLARNARIFVNFTVVSEFINRTLRINYLSHVNFHGLDTERFTFKKFRNSTDGQSYTQTIYSVVANDILKHCNLHGQDISDTDIKDFLTVDHLDFQDKLIEKVCRDNDFILCTNDTDFKNSDIAILSTHPQLN